MALKAVQGTPEGLDFVFIGIFLALSEFETFENSLHLIKRFAQRFDDLVHLFDGLLD